MRSSLFKGLSFGLTSGIITTLGMMIGLYSSTGSRLAVIGGILSIAIADSFSDALGIHVSEESDRHKSHRHVWAATISTFISKLLFSLTFIVPVLFFALETAIIISIIWGISLLILLNFYIAKVQKEKPLMVIGEHLLIAMAVIVITYYAGRLISLFFS